MVCTNLNRRTPRPGVYIIGSAKYGWYKIGYSRFVQQRLAHLRRTLPFAVSLFSFWRLGWADESKPFNPSRVERCIHALFVGNSINGEWFKLSGPPDIEALDRVLRKVAAELHFNCSREDL
jgi:hypothetical protein